jgi:V8-like Glu-specific endopeptidase
MYKNWSQRQTELLPEFEAIINEFEEELYPEMEFEFSGETSYVSRTSPEYIKWVQNSLNKILGLNLLVDGKAGTATKNAITAFQKQNGIDAIGTAGPKTEAAIKAALNKNPVVNNAVGKPITTEELLSIIKPRAAFKSADNIAVEIPIILPQNAKINFSDPSLLRVTGMLGKYIDLPACEANPVARSSREQIKMMQKELRSVPGMAPDHLPLLPLPNRLPEALSSKSQTHTRLSKLRPKDVHEPTTVFNPDERRIFRDSAYPWSCIGRVETAATLTKGFSGVLVGPRHLLTCSHGVQWLAQNKNGWIKFTPAYFDGGTPPFGFAYGVRTYYYVKVNGSDGIDREEGQYDYVVVVLNSRIGERAGYMGSRSWSDDWDDKPYWSHVGYPDDISSTQRPTFQNRIALDGSFWDREIHTRIFHKGDVFPGQSGGPFFAWWKNEFYPSVVSVQSGQSDDENSASGGADMVELIAKARREYP